MEFNDDEIVALLNRLLEKLHQADSNNQGSTVINIYGKGSLHVDHVDNQYFYGDKWTERQKDKKEAKHNKTASGVPFDGNTPLSALFRENHHDKLKAVIESWRPYLLNDDKAREALALTSFVFDMERIRPVSIYMDLAHLVNHDALRLPMSVLAAYMFQHSNMSRSQNALYVQLKRYRKMCE
jgi:hypothetical protein